MNKNLNLVKILKGCPMGTTLYSPIYGNVTLDNLELEELIEYPITVKTIDMLDDEDINYVALTAEGFLYKGYKNSECVLFPSKTERDWSKFVSPIHDKSLVWCWDRYDAYQRVLKFYDAINESTFSQAYGLRNNKKYDNYELFKGEEPEWAIESRKDLEY